MNIIASWWRKICVPLDGFLWHKNISHSIIRPVLRNLILVSGLCLLLGAAFYTIYPEAFWYACGLLCMSWIFWSWARLFLRISLQNYGAALLRMVFISFMLRLALLAILLYFAMTVFNASAIAIVAGMVTGGVISLAAFAWNLRKTC